MMFFVLWFVATFYFWGDLGKWADDWSFHLRRPGTLEVDWSRMLALDAWGSRFWRPFNMRFASTLQTIFWHADWASHLVLALLHGLNGWLLWKLLLRFCASRRAAAAGALAFVVYPAGHEAIYWMSTLGTSAGLAGFLACTLAATRLAAGGIGWKGLAWLAPVLLTLGWWYEQAAACAPAIALAYLACAPIELPLFRRLRTATILGAAGILAGLLYAALFLGFAPPNQRGHAGSIVTGQTILPHAGLIWRQTVEYLTLHEFGRGAFEHGWQAFRSKPAQAIVIAVVFGAAVLWFGSWWMRGRVAADPSDRRPDHPYRTARPTPLQRAMAVLFGLAVFAACLVPPMAVSNQWFCSRLSYIPVVGLVVALTAALDGLLSLRLAESRIWTGRVVRGCALALLLPMLVAGALMLVGVQSVWHGRARADERLMSQLREALPVLPEHSVLVPVSVRDRLVETRSARFNSFHAGPFEASWSAMSFTRRVFGRRDVYGLEHSRWKDVANAVNDVVGATSDGLLMRAGVLHDSPFPPDSAGRRTVPWKHVVAIRITRQGTLTLPDSIHIEAQGNPAFDRTVRLTAVDIPRRLRDRAGIIAAAPESVVSGQAVDWSLVQTSGGAAAGDRRAPEVKPVWASNRILECFAIHPAIPTMSTPTAAVAVLPASPVPRRLAWRVGMMDYLWRTGKPLTDGVGLGVWLDGHEQPLIRELVTPARLRKTQNWIAMVVEVPPLAEPKAITIRVDPGPSTDASCDWLLVTPPVLSSVRPAPAAVSAEPGTSPPSGAGRP